MISLLVIDEKVQHFSHVLKKYATVQMMAPGVSVLNLGLAGTYTKETGTSMATPHVAGAAALLLQK